MNKTYISLILTILGCSFFLFSCHKNQNQTTDLLELDSLCINETTHLFADTSKPSCNLVLNYTFIKNSKDSLLRDSINKIFRTNLLGNKYLNASNAEAVETYANQYAKDYCTKLEPIYLEEAKENNGENDIESWYSYYCSMKSSVIYCSDNYLVYQIDYSDYTGGAHGMYATSFLNIDLTNKKQLTLDDLFQSEYSEILTDLITNQLIAENGVTCREELEELGYGTTGNISHTENFYLNEEGITFLYNPYDIAPYSMGETRVTIPYQMLGHILDETLPIIQNFN